MFDTNRIVLHTTDAIYFADINDIVYCQSDNSYTTFYFVNQLPVVVSRNIKDYECQLAGFGFIRPHQSFLVNLAHLQKIDKTNGYILVLSGNKQIPTSTRKRKELIQILQKELRFQAESCHIQI